VEFLSSSIDLAEYGVARFCHCGLAAKKQNFATMNARKHAAKPDKFRTMQNKMLLISARKVAVVVLSCLLACIVENRNYIIKQALTQQG
jgi:hypothetical protein